jgi:hypothetical protein
LHITWINIQHYYVIQELFNAGRTRLFRMCQKLI